MGRELLFRAFNSLAAASDKLTADFGTWKTKWGDINRFQRLTDDIVHPFTDVNIEFVDPTGTGEYRIARNPFEKDAMLFVPGAAPTTDGRSQADYVIAAAGFGNPFSLREEDSPFNSLELRRILESAPPAPKHDPF